MRCTVARALVRIYQGGSLDDAQKKQILAQRNWITAEHRDNSTHTDRGHDDKVACSSMHQDTHVDTRRPHIDQTIGVDFPL